MFGLTVRGIKGSSVSNSGMNYYYWREPRKFIDYSGLGDKRNYRRLTNDEPVLRKRADDYDIHFIFAIERM